MKLPIQIDHYTVTRKGAGRGMVKLQHNGETVGLLDTAKLLDDLPRVIGRKLTIDEQVALTLAVPGIAA
ncbi:hypothetical protein [Lacticaseibacillus daqingensis]|uniref:hypothetical protein n=1 Tax=Lacticaseibacillus daqingensis TaxID=2486014 RepID=UPI000F790971|nr:hypothetical protein [Lacticaseibacillus daqingensis]